MDELDLEISCDIDITARPVVLDDDGQITSYGAKIKECGGVNLMITLQADVDPEDPDITYCELGEFDWYSNYQQSDLINALKSLCETKLSEYSGDVVLKLNLEDMSLNCVNVYGLDDFDADSSMYQLGPDDIFGICVPDEYWMWTIKDQELHEGNLYPGEDEL